MIDHYSTEINTLQTPKKLPEKLLQEKNWQYEINNSM